MAARKAKFEMSKEDKEILRCNYRFLTDNLILSDIYPYLIQDNILTEDIIERIQHDGITTKGRNQQFLLHLPKRGPDAFVLFVDALHQSGQVHIAAALEEEKAKYGGSLAAAQPLKHETAPSLSLPYPVQATTEASGDGTNAGLSSADAESELPATMKPVQINSQWIQDILNSPDVYKLPRRRRGLAVIINNQIFSNRMPRDGASFDSENLFALFKELHFEPHLYCDKSAQEMKTILEETKSSLGESDCFVLFILSHGVKDHVCGTDGQRLSIKNDIVDQFDSSRCPSLTGIPKIFFIQACQRDVAQNSAGVQTESSDGDILKYMDLLSLQVDDDSHPNPHHKADIVVSFSTVPGYQSWRNPDSGSWFVKVIVNVFRQHAHQDHLLDLLTKVNNEVSEQNKDVYFNAGPVYKQLTEFKSTLKKKLYFLPGYSAN